MRDVWAELSWVIYGLSYMVLGVAVAARAAAFPSSTLRNRLLCLALSSGLHSLYIWMIFSSVTFDQDLPGKIRYIVEAFSFVPLCYFATGFDGVRARILRSLLVTTAVATLLLSLFTDEPGYLQFVVHVGLAFPASAFAVYALLHDPVFRVKNASPELALKIAAYSLAVFSATQLVLTKADYYPASIANSANFIEIFGFSPFALRVVCGAVFMLAILALLNRFDEAMRAEAEKATFETRKALRLSQAKLADILSNSPEGIIITDKTGRIEMFNGGAEAIFGWRADEVIGKNVEMLIPERFRQSHAVLAEGFVRGSQHYRIKESQTHSVTNRPRMGRPELSGLRRNGEEFPLAASLSKITTPDGLWVTTIVRDISRHKAEQKELLDAKRKAEDSSRAKSQFIANMSHELRTPLNAIIGFSEMLKLDAFAPRRSEYANLICVSGEHLLNLINDILDLAKIEAGRFELREAPMNFSTVADEAIRMLAHKAKGGGISLVSEVSEILPALYADERAIKQVLINLTGNALKFTPQGGTVTLFARLESNGNFAFGVKDTGVGISEQDQARLFKEFGQGSHDAFTGEKGTGLGLKIAKALTLAHDGTITLQSKQGAGTTFTVTLPASRVRTVVAA